MLHYSLLVFVQSGRPKVLTIASQKRACWLPHMMTFGTRCLELIRLKNMEPIAFSLTLVAVSCVSRIILRLLRACDAPTAATLASDRPWGFT